MKLFAWIYSFSAVALLMLFLLPARAAAQTTSDTSEVVRASTPDEARKKVVPEAGRKAAIAQAESAQTPRLPDGHPDLNGS